jgi:crotonobetainyl-CoA:carnitine CoA-transferase CaiB-like acyl-CoA transferase
MRSIGPFVGDYSLFWAVEGRGRKSVTCDLRKPAGQALAKRLVARADVVVENFQPGTLESWGLGYDALAAVNPGVILTRVSVYGQTGPYRDRPGLDRNGIAMGGLLYITGYPDRPPVRPGLIVSDYLTGVFNAFAIVSALYERDRRARETGAPPRGQWVELSLYESILRVMEHTLAAYDRLGVVREREGNRLKNSAPLDNWPTKDGKWVCIIAAGDSLFPRLCRAIGREDLLQDPRFTTMGKRAEHGDVINAVVAAWCAERTSREIQDVLERHEVPFGIAYSVADIFADPHVAARGDIVTVDDPVIGPVRMQGVYPRFSRTPGDVPAGAPRLGAHNREVYGSLLGLSADEIAALERERVI